MTNSGTTKRAGTIKRRALLKVMVAGPATALVSEGQRSAAQATKISPAPAPEHYQEEYDPQQLNPYAIKSLPALADVVPTLKFIWADLRAFDNTSPGFGAPGYLRNLGFNPDAISILIAHSDFVFIHNNISLDVPLEARFAVYGAGNVPCQDWRRSQLKGLIEHMHKARVKVLLGLMTMVPQGDHGWFGRHPEVLTMTKDGEVQPAVNPLKQFKDGQLFEDVFVENLHRTMQTFGFDGFHGADGFTHLRVPLHVADFSDDMVGQFLSETKIELPASLSRQCGADSHAIGDRAQWVLSQKRLEWTGFWRQRWAGFWEKVTQACKRNRMMVVANQPWTRDPYEAIYRYGFDYKVLEKARIDALVVETVAGPAQTGACLRNSDGTGLTAATRVWLEDATCMVMCVKAYVPSLPLVFLLCVQDENELWDTLRVAPEFLEREIFSYVSTFYVNDRGKLECCLDGFMVCLGVGLSREEWKRVGRTAAGAFSIASANSLKNSSVTAVWSDQGMENLLKNHLARGDGLPKPPLHSLLKMLLHEGAPVRTIVRCENLQLVESPLLVVNPEFIGDDENAKIGEWVGKGDSPRSLIAIGEDLGSLNSKVLMIRDDTEYGKIQCAVTAKNREEERRLRGELSGRLKLYAPERPNTPMVLAIEKTSGAYFPFIKDEPVAWYQLIPYTPIYHDFVVHAAQATAIMANAAATSDHGKIFSMERASGARFVIVENDNPVYLWCTLSVNKPVKRLRFISSIFAKRPIMHGDTTFDIKIAPNGVTVMELDFHKSLI